MGNERFSNALNRRAQKTPPIWFMRQAGRYHRHYQELRKEHGFMQLCKTPELAAEVAMGPIRDFDFDVSIMFSDLLFPLEALGMGLSYQPGPKLEWQLTEKNLKQICSPQEALPKLMFQKEVLQKTRALLPQDKSLIGFIGGPLTLFAYAVEGGHNGGLAQTKAQLGLFNRFCEVLIPLLQDNIKLQLEGGAEIVMIFDTSAGELSRFAFHDLVLPQLQKLTRPFAKKLGYYSKGSHAGHFRHDFFQNGNLAGIGFDHRWDMAQAFQVSHQGFVQGNFDQGLLFLPEDQFVSYVEQYCGEINKLSQASRQGWVFGLGHGILPQTPEKNVRYLVKLIREIVK